MLAVSVTVPVLVSLEGHGGLLDETGHLVRTIGHGGCKRGLVVGNVEVIGALNLGHTCLVEILVNDPVTREVVKKVEACKRLAENESDLVLAGLDDTNVSEIVVRSVVDLLCKVVVDIGLILAPLGVTCDNVNDPSIGLVVKRSITVLISCCYEICPIGSAEVLIAVCVNVLSKSVGIKIRDYRINCNEHGEALRREPLAILCLEVIGNSVVGTVLDYGLTLIVVVLSACDAKRTIEVIGSSVVKKLGIKELLHGVNVSISIDSYAVLPSSVGVKSDLVRIAGGCALGNVVLVVIKSLDLLGNVNGKSCCHLGNDLITCIRILALYGVKLIVEDEGVETCGEEVHGIGLIGGLVGVRVPVRRKNGNRVIVGIGLNRICGGAVGRLVETRSKSAYYREEHASNKCKTKYLLECLVHNNEPP